MAKYTGILLGATKYNELVFADIDMRKMEDDKIRFGVCFNCVRPFNEDNIDLAERYENMVDSMDADTKLYHLEQLDCKPSELAEEMEYGGGIDDVIDVYYDADEVLIDGDTWMYEFMSCGQHDTRGDMAEYVNEDAYNELHELWDKHHLKYIDVDVIARVDSLIDELCDYNEGEWIADYIKRHIDELEQ